jgi:transposase
MAKDKKTGGRRTKLTPEVHEKIVSAIRAGNYARVAAEYAGVGERTFYRWLQRGQEAQRGIYRQFWQAVKKAEREAEVRAVAIIQKHMEDNWQAAMTYLERKYPDRWGRRDRLRVDLNPKEALEDLLSLTAEELEEAVETAARHR